MITRRGRKRESQLRRYDRAFGRWLIVPAIVVIGAVSIGPLIFSVWVAFVRFHLRSFDWPFVGLRNFSDALADPVFRRAVIFTVVLAAALSLLELVIGTGLAVALTNRSRAWRRILIPIIVAPMFLSPVVVGQIWRLFMLRASGPFNYLVELVVGEPVNIDFLADRTWNLLPIIASDVWMWTALPFVITFAALSGIDKGLLEAATIDGAGAWGRIRYIMLPLIWPALLTAMFFRFADGLRIYGTIFMLSRGGPGRDTTPISMFLTERGFSGSFDLGLVSAASWIFLLIVAIVTYRLVRRVALT